MGDSSKAASASTSPDDPGSSPISNAAKAEADILRGAVASVIEPDDPGTGGIPRTSDGRAKHVVYSRDTLLVNFGYKRSHDALTTADALVVISLGLVMILAAFYVFMSVKLDIPLGDARRDGSKSSLFASILESPCMILSGGVALGAIFFAFEWGHGASLENIVKLFSVFLIICAVVMTIVGFDVPGSWSNDTYAGGLAEVLSSPRTYLWTWMSFILFGAMSVASVQGTIRMDKFSIVDPVFIALLLTVFMVSYVMMETYALAIRTASLHADGQTSGTRFGGIFAGVMIAFVLIMFALLRVGEKLTVWYATKVLNERQIDSATIADIIHRAAKRTVQTVQWLLMLAMVVPALLVLSSRDQFNLTEEQKALADSDMDAARTGIREEWGRIVGVLGFILFVMPFVGLAGKKISDTFGSFCSLLGNAAVAASFFILATQEVYWDNRTSWILVAIYAFVVFNLAVDIEIPGEAIMAFFAAGVVIVTRNLIGQLIALIERTTEGAIPLTLRNVAWGVPLVIITAFWAGRSYLNKRRTFTTALFLLCFSVVYAVLFSLLGSTIAPSSVNAPRTPLGNYQYLVNTDVSGELATGEEESGAGGSGSGAAQAATPEIANIAMDFIVLFGVLSISLSLCKFFRAVIPPENQDLLRAQADALSPVRSEPVYSRLGLATLILIYGVGSYAAAFAYGTLGAREDFTTYIRDGQDHIKEVYRGIYADMARGIGKSPPDSS